MPLHPAEMKMCVKREKLYHSVAMVPVMPLRAHSSAMRFSAARLISNECFQRAKASSYVIFVNAITFHFMFMLQIYTFLLYEPREWDGKLPSTTKRPARHPLWGLSRRPWLYPSVGMGLSRKPGCGPAAGRRTRSSTRTRRPCCRQPSRCPSRACCSTGSRSSTVARSPSRWCSCIR